LLETNRRRHISCAHVDSGQITMTRNNTAGDADVGWFAVQFKTRRTMLAD
jgi:hypothetical protein